jgi:glycine oxidase
VIGLSIGWRLQAGGLQVGIFDAGERGAASPAASGMLAAAAEIEPCSSDLFRLAIQSQRLWPEFRAALEGAAGGSIDYRDHGLRFRFDLQRREGADVRWLQAGEVLSLEPSLRPSVSAGILCPQDHQIDPRRMLAALRKAFLKAGGLLVERCRVEAIDMAAGRAAGILTAQGSVTAPTVIVATGAWSGTSALAPLVIEAPVRPLKGQSLSLTLAPGTPSLARVVWTNEIHIAPKADRLVVGATVEEAGFDASPTAGGLYAVLEAARRVLPSFEEWRIEALQVGFRPTSADDAPIIGEAGVPGVLLATGHHRNGYLLAPVTAAAVESLVRHGKMLDAAAPFGLARFATPQQAKDRMTRDADHHQRSEARL